MPQEEQTRRGQVWPRLKNSPHFTQAFIALAVLAQVSPSMFLRTWQSVERWLTCQPWTAQPPRPVLEEEGEEE